MWEASALGRDFMSKILPRTRYGVVHTPLPYPPLQSLHTHFINFDW